MRRSAGWQKRSFVFSKRFLFPFKHWSMGNLSFIVIKSIGFLFNQMHLLLLYHIYNSEFRYVQCSFELVTSDRGGLIGDVDASPSRRREPVNFRTMIDLLPQLVAIRWFLICWPGWTRSPTEVPQDEQAIIASRYQILTIKGSELTNHPNHHQQTTSLESSIEHGSRRRISTNTWDTDEVWPWRLCWSW